MKRLLLIAVGCVAMAALRAFARLDDLNIFDHDLDEQAEADF